MSVRSLSDIAAQIPGVDELGIDRTRRVAQQIVDAVQDAKMNPTIPLKVARAVVEKKLPAGELAPLLDAIVAGRSSGSIRSPGAYFVVSCKRLFQRHEIIW